MIDEAYDGGPDKTAESIIASYDAMMGELRPSISERRDYEAFSESPIVLSSGRTTPTRGLVLWSVSAPATRSWTTLYGGLQAPDLIIIAAGRAWVRQRSPLTSPSTSPRPSTLLQEWWHFASLEMSAEQVSSRIIAEQAGLPGWKVRRGKLDQTR